MIMNRKHIVLFMKPFIILLVMAASVITFNSCGNDEEEEQALIDYYLNISSTESIGVTSEDEEQGTMGQPSGNVLANTIWKMKKALRDVYPEANTQGNDIDVVYSIDKIYKQYKAMYGHLERNTVCVVKLYRVMKINGRIRNSTALQVYHFGAIPPAQE